MLLQSSQQVQVLAWAWAVSSPVHLGVDTPEAELLHCTIAVDSLGGLEAPSYI